MEGFSDLENNLNDKNNQLNFDESQLKKRKIIRIFILLIALIIIAAIIVLVLVLRPKDDDKTNNENPIPFADKYIDLHLHLDGAITLDIAKKLAYIQNITLPSDNDTELEAMLSVPDNCSDLNDFLKCFDFPLTLMQTYEGIKESVRLVADNILSQGVIYAEIRFAPQLHKQNNLTQEEVIQAALEGLNMTKLKANLILCCMRGDSNETDIENEETLELTKKYLVEDGGVVALDIAGAEALYNTSKYRDLFAKAKEYNVPYTIHAGEADGPISVKYAIEFGTKRIGHGVRIYEDPEVVDLVKNENVTLEMCPTSNRYTHSIADMSTYPFMDYLKKV